MSHENCGCYGNRYSQNVAKTMDPDIFRKLQFPSWLDGAWLSGGGWGVNDQTVSVFKVETVHDIFFVVHVSWVFFLIFPPFSLLFFVRN